MKGSWTLSRMSAAAVARQHISLALISGKTVATASANVVEMVVVSRQRATG